MASHFSDPRCEALDKMLAGLSPRRELAYRIAYIYVSEHCRGDDAWRGRVTELRHRVGKAALSGVFNDAEQITDDLIKSAN